MRHCPKCQLTYGDSSRICRACGAILDEMDDPAPLPTEAVAEFAMPDVEEDHGEEITPFELADAAALLPDTPATSWICTACGERVPITFDVCWNCEASGPLSSAGDPAAAVAKPTAPSPGEDVAPSPFHSADHGERLLCPSCHSDRVIPGVQILDQAGSYVGSLQVVVPGQPHAVIFKDRLHGELVADICGACGHVALRVLNPDKLYEHYLKSFE